MRAGEVWRHRRCTEVDLYIAEIKQQGSDYKAVVYYLNRQAFLPENELLNFRPDFVTIKNSELLNWSRVQ